jgi:transcription antitermination factor NusG
MSGVIDRQYIEQCRIDQGCLQAQVHDKPWANGPIDKTCSARDCAFDFTWYALRTRHQHEKVAAESLSNKRFEVFLPLYQAVRQWKDRTKRLSLPLFPCYLFLHGGLDRWRDVVTTPGVQGVVNLGGRASAIPDAEIEAVRRLVDGSLQVEPHPFLKCGDWVRVMWGPLAGIEGILVRKKNQFRLVLSVDMLGKSVSVEVDAATVETFSTGAAHIAASQATSYAARLSTAEWEPAPQFS